MHRSFSVVGVATLVVFGVLTWNWHRCSPEYALKIVDTIHNVTDLNAHTAYFTDQGLQIERVLLSFPLAAQQDQAFGKPQIDGNRMSVEASSAKNTTRWFFVRNSVWQLDDIVYTRMDDHPWNARLSEVAEPLRALVMAGSLKTPEAITNETHFLTEKGKKVLLYNLTHASSDPSGPAPNLKMRDPVVADNRVTFPFELEAGSRISAVIVKNAEWQYDDLIIESIQGRDVNLSLSYKIDHPVKAFLQTVDVEHFTEKTIKWFIIGYSAAKALNSGR